MSIKAVLVSIRRGEVDVEVNEYESRKHLFQVINGELEKIGKPAVPEESDVVELNAQGAERLLVIPEAELYISLPEAEEEEQEECRTVS